LKRLFFAIALPYDDPDSFWTRESGLIVIGLREMGYEAFLVVLHPLRDKTPDSSRPAITCTLEQMSDPAWWTSQKPDAIVLNLWSAPRYDAIRKAALKATPRVIERLDTAGVRVPRIWPHYYFTASWSGYRDNGWNPWIALFPTVLRCLLFYFVPSALERPMALTMAQLPYVVAESPLAAARTERHIRWYSQGPNQVAQISNPVYTQTMNYGPGDTKTNALVAIARWDTYQKDFPMLIGTAIAFLQKYPDWTFDVIGKGVDRYQKLLAQAPPEVSTRIHIHGRLPQPQVAAINRRAKIHFMASRCEGFANASVEALCCGCSYVGPINLAASSYLIENQSGTIASRRRKEDLLDALCAEAEAWKAGRRNPAAISEKWIAESGYIEVARRTLALLESIPERASASALPLK
jgi:glycosyltransferase involved in cell wall biosynthesis